MHSEISPGKWPVFETDEVTKVCEVLNSGKVNYWTGTEGREFEREFSKLAETDYAIALANGTVALELALKALGVGCGDDVIVTPRTFIASVSSILNCGATPVFADVDTDSQNISAETISRVITSRTKAVICVHLAGWPCEMDEIMSLAERNGFYVIEDCAQAHGAKYKGRSVGGIGHVGAWSFCQDKIMSTGGEGGMLTTNSKEIWNKAWSYKDHGRSYDAVYNRDHPPGHRWYCESIGTNWLLTEMQSAIGRIQLQKMPRWHSQRLSNYRYLERICLDIEGLRTPRVPRHMEHAGYRFYTFLRPDRIREGWDQDRIVSEINEMSGLCLHGSCSEVYLEKAFSGGACRPQSRLPNAKLLGETSLAFLIHPTLTEYDLERLKDAICSTMSQAIE